MGSGVRRSVSARWYQLESAESIVPTGQVHTPNVDQVEPLDVTA